MNDLKRMEELSNQMAEFKAWREEVAKENARLHEKVNKAERYMGMEQTKTKSGNQVPELTDEAIKELVENIRKRPEVKDQTAIKEGIVTAMSSDIKKKNFRGYAHLNTSDWMKFSRAVLEKGREYDYGHAVLIQGDHRMDDWISENQVQYGRIQHTYYQMVVDLCTEDMRDSTTALELDKKSNRATELFEVLAKIATDNVHEAFKKHQELVALKFEPKHYGVERVSSKCTEDQ